MAKKGFSVFFFFVLFLFCFFSCVICGSAVQCFLNTLPTVVCDVWINSKSVKLWRLIDCVWRNESISVLQSRVMCARGSDWNALCPDFKRKVKKKGYFSVEGRRKPASEFSDGMLHLLRLLYQSTTTWGKCFTFHSITYLLISVISYFADCMLHQSQRSKILNYCGSGVEPACCYQKAAGSIPLVCTLQGSHRHPCIG